MPAAWGYSRVVVSMFLSLLGVVAFIVCTISVAAFVTWSVIRLTAIRPGRRSS